MNKKHFVITVERQYGSGGRLTGKRLAEELGIHFYDEEILKMTSETSAIGEQYYRLADEKAGNNLLYRIVTGMKPDLGEPVRDGDNITSPENLFRFQSSVIRKLAGQESCIIVGRCGNYVLQDQLDDVIRIFVYADTVTRVRRVIEVDQVDEKEALRRMKRIDKERKEYYRARVDGHGELRPAHQRQPHRLRPDDQTDQGLSGAAGIRDLKAAGRERRAAISGEGAGAGHTLRPLLY